MTQPVIRQQDATKPDTKPTRDAKPNGQIPLRGKTASDEDVQRISRKVMNRDRRLLELLAK